MIEHMQRIDAAILRFTAFRDLALDGIRLHDSIEKLRERQNAKNLECIGEGVARLHRYSSERSGFIPPRQPRSGELSKFITSERL